MQTKKIIRRFTCPKKAVLFSKFFSSSLFINFLCLLRQKKGSQPVKSRFVCVGQKKKNAQKEPVKRIAILRHVNRLCVTFV